MTSTVHYDTPVWVALSATPHSIDYVQIGPWRTRVLLAGPADGEPLVLMPGTGGHLEAYAHNISAFAEAYRVIAYDYPGHGYTTHATADLELPHYVEHLGGLLDSLDIDRANLNGESLGGWVAINCLPTAAHTIWGAVAVYRAEPVGAGMDVLGQLAELATEPLSSLGSRRPEGIS